MKLINYIDEYLRNVETLGSVVFKIYDEFCWRVGVSHSEEDVLISLNKLRIRTVSSDFKVSCGFYRNVNEVVNTIRKYIDTLNIRNESEICEVSIDIDFSIYLLTVKYGFLNLKIVEKHGFLDVHYTLNYVKEMNYLTISVDVNLVDVEDIEVIQKLTQCESLKKLFELKENLSKVVLIEEEREKRGVRKGGRKDSF